MVRPLRILFIGLLRRNLRGVFLRCEKRMVLPGFDECFALRKGDDGVGQISMPMLT
jgi:hypothetical protein